MPYISIFIKKQHVHKCTPRILYDHDTNIYASMETHLFELSHIGFGANKRITVNLNGNPNPQELIDIDRVFRVKHVSNNSSLKRQEAEVGRKRNLKRDVFSQEADGSLPTGYLQVLKSLESQFSG